MYIVSLKARLQGDSWIQREINQKATSESIEYSLPFPNRFLTQRARKQPTLLIAAFGSAVCPAA